MIKRRLYQTVILGLATLGLVVGLSRSGVLFVSHAASPKDYCKAPDEVTGAVASLPRVAAALKAHTQLRVLAVGSATMFGPDATLSPGTLTSQSFNATGIPSAPAAQPITQEASDLAFPWQMARKLEAAVPGLKVDVVIRGGRGMSAADMLAVMRKELATGKYQMVLWQTGTVEAVRNSPPGEFAQTLLEGAEAVDTAGANLVLIDSQYSRFLQTNSNLDPYSQAFTQTAAMPGVLLFHRFELMRTWVSDGQIDLERTPRGDRKRMVDTLHACLGQHLARMVLEGARS